MYCYVVALVLLVTYSGSLGGPLPTSPLLNSLTALATSCGDPFLSSQITAQLDECTVTVPPYNEKQFECLIFYDINTQLCDAVASSKLSLSEDYTKKINEATEVEQVCTSAKQWNFLNLTDYPIYGATASKVFNNPITCVKICGVENVMSQDANFFCKYFKWGSEMLKNSVLAPSAVSSTAPVASNRPLPETQGKSQPEAVSASEDDIKVSPPMASNVGSVPNDTTKEAKTIKAMDKTEEISKVEEVKPDPNPQMSTAKNLDIDDLEVNKYEKPSVDAPDAPTNVEASNDSLDKPSAAAVDPQKKEEEEVKDSDQTVKAQVPNPKEAVPDKNKIEDDYQDSEEGKEGLPEGSDDGDDPILGDLDTKSDTFTQTKGSKKIETPMSFVGEREFYPNTIPDGFADDDDHFFPFFLTAVILVVLLYVLYHNKSKVSKVFLGLIVEGRQSGRRRNSRGHAYRRLDTLEQAMSTNSSAPPSKIIY